jgi:hypothetical protein
MTFTIKFYSGDGCRQIVKEAESFTILRSPAVFTNWPNSADAEITLHQKHPVESTRIDIGDDRPHGAKRPEGWPPLFAKAIIENSAGRTTEIVGTLGPNFRPWRTMKSSPSPTPRVSVEPHDNGHRDRRSA